MELLTDKQIAELTLDYENRVKVLIEKIKGELQNRKELKKKIEEAKQREILQLQILERLEESEKLVRKQIDLVAKMEDNESLKQRELIKKYTQMLDEQKNTWQKYKEEYESLPSVKKIRQAEAKYMCASIKHRLVLKKFKDAQRMVQLRELVRKKQEQALVIKFAQLMLDYMKRQKHCQELWDLNRKLTAQAQQLRQQLQEKETDKKQKLKIELQKASALMKPQQLPQVDLSRFIIHRDKGQDKFDTMSINSYILEEEYINNNGQSSQPINSSQNKAMDVDTQESMTMEIDTQEINSQEFEAVQTKEPPRRLHLKGASDNKDKTQRNPPVDERNIDEHNTTFNQEIDSQESHPDNSGITNTSRKRMSQMQQQNKENTLLNGGFADDGKVQNEYSTPYNCPIPTPTKMPKSLFQQKHPHQQTSKQETGKSSFQEKRPHNQMFKHQETVQQQQNSQISKRSVQENQQHKQSSRHSSQDMYEQEQSSRQSSQEVYQQQKVSQQSSRQSSQEVYQQQKVSQPSSQKGNQQKQVLRQSSQEVHRQQQVSQQSLQKGNQEQQVSRQSSQEMYQQQQQHTYQQNHQQQQSLHYSSEPNQHQQNQYQQEMYLRSEQSPPLHQQMHVSPQNSEEMDFSRLPSANKPKIISDEFINYDLQALNYKSSKRQPPAAESTPRIETPIANNTSATSKTESTPFAYHVPFTNEAQTSENVTPMSVEIEPSSMMSTSMLSADSNSYMLPDNISAILGSEITEPGGSYELAKRLYDSDLNSDDGDLDYDKIMRNACSPMNKISPKVHYPRPPGNSSSQQPGNANTQPPANISTSQNIPDSNERAFSFGIFAKKQQNTTQRFF